MSSVRKPKKDPCYLIWEHTADGLLFLRAIDTDKDLADYHIETLKRENIFFEWKRGKSRFHIETSQLNHMYGRKQR